MRFAASEAPEQKAVDGAERERAGFGRRARASHMIKQPCDFAGGEIRIEQEPGLACYLALVTGPPQCLAVADGAPILPDDCIVDGFSSAAIPDHRGFALIGDANAGDVVRREICLR